MGSKKRKLLRLAYLAFLAVISITVTVFCAKFLRRPTPINKNNLPYEFLVVGRASPDDSFTLLTLYEHSKGIQYKGSDRDIEEIKKNRDILWSHGEIIWPDEMPRYEYYIQKNDLAKITNILNRKLALDSNQITLRISDDDSNIRMQTIHLTHAPESIHQFVYEVVDKKVIPLKYGHFTKQDGILALIAGALIFSIGYIFFKKVKAKYSITKVF